MSEGPRPMTDLITMPNIAEPDGFYAELLALHEGRAKAESDLITARLVLILANHIGDRDTLRQAFDLAVAPPPATLSKDGSRP